MTGPELIALSLAASIVTAVLAGLAALGMDHMIADPRQRERGWSLALWTPLIAPLAVALWLLAPAPVVEQAPIASAPIVSEIPAADIVAAAPPPIAAPAFFIDWNLAALIVVGAAGLAALARLTALGLRARRLAYLIAETTPADADLTRRIETAAMDLKIAAPAACISQAADEALLVGLFRPVLILPARLAQPPAQAVVAHELAHLKRGDHVALWLEEGLRVVLAFNPVTPALHRRRAAVREEACDALALAGASAEARRDYAQSLIEALRARAASRKGAQAPALTFTGAERSFALSRLKAVLNPAPAAGRGTRAALIVAGAALLALTGAGSWAVAAQRAPGYVSVASSVDFDGPTLDEDDGKPVTLADAAWLSAAMKPVYKVVWPQACGFGTEDGKVFVHAEKGCTASEAPNPVIQSLAGIDPAASPRAAFVAVKRACDAGRTVPVVYVQGADRKTIEVACSTPAAAPPPQKDFEVALTWGEVALERGDVLEINLVKQIGADTHRRSLVFPLDGQTRLPAMVTARVGQEFFGEAHSPEMTAILYDRNGTPKARTDAAQPRRPMLVSVGKAIGFATLVTVATPQDTSATTPQFDPNSPERQAGLASARARYEGYTASQYKAACESGDVMDGGYCSGVLFSQLPALNAYPHGICAPTLANGDYDAVRIAREGRRIILGLGATPEMTPAALAKEALKAAYPCPSGRVVLLHGRPLPEGLPEWAAYATRVTIWNPAYEKPETWDWDAPATPGRRVRIDGHLMPGDVSVTNISEFAIKSRTQNAAGEIELTLRSYEEYRAAVEEANRARRSTA